MAAFLDGRNGLVARLARQLLARCRELTATVRDLEAEITALVNRLAPALLEIPGCSALTAAKILGETAGITRFKSKSAYARHNGTAPLPVWSGNRERHRLSRMGNRQQTSHYTASPSRRLTTIPKHGTTLSAAARPGHEHRIDPRPQMPTFRCRLSGLAPRRSPCRGATGPPRSSCLA
ncbi:transposase [Streptomyces cupreus]|uniref:transposase n=1 Tax=Streptomyces cupreus TaxID=2759956 RepID=UPI003AB94B49